MAAEYSEDTIQEFADELYAQATWIMFKWLGAGLLVGLLTIPFTAGLGVLTVPLLGFGGYLMGKQKSLALRMEAQSALCLRQVERNTRGDRIIGGDA